MCSATFVNTGYRGDCHVQNPVTVHLSILVIVFRQPISSKSVNERGKVERNLVFTNSSMSSATFATQVLVLALVFGTVLLFNFVFAVFALSDTICRFLGCQHGNE